MPQISLSPGEILTLTRDDESSLSQNYAFVMNIHQIVDAEVVKLGEWHELRRATEREIAQIKQTIEPLLTWCAQHRQGLWEY